MVDKNYKELVEYAGDLKEAALCEDLNLVFFDIGKINRELTKSYFKDKITIDEVSNILARVRGVRTFLLKNYKLARR